MAYREFHERTDGSAVAVLRRRPNRPGSESANYADALSLHPDVYAGQNQGRRGNLLSALESHRQSNPEFWNSLRGQSVLVRPNIVDPEFPQGCSNAEALECVLEQLIASGVSRIDVGDLSSADYYDSHPDANPQLIYKDLVDRLTKQHPEIELSLLDLRSLNQIRLADTDLPIIDTSQYAALVDLVLPKEHGQYYFSCGTKHLMGLVDPSARRAYFHPESLQDAITRVTNNSVLIQKLYEEVSAIKDPNSQNLELNARLVIAADSELDPSNMKYMARFIQEMVNNLARKGTPILTVVDGYETLTGHEHSGDLVKTDFAIAGLNPLAVDLLAARHIGLEEQAGYLTELSHLVNPEINGDQLSPAVPYKLKRVPRDIKLSSDGNFSFSIGVVKE